MKRLLVIFIVLALPVVVQAQAATAYGNFKLADQEIFYQKVFLQDSITPAKLAEYYKTLPYIANVNVAGDEVTFEVNDITVDYKKFQFTQVATPSIIQTGKYSGKVHIGVKDGKYRITFSALELTGNIGYKNITSKDKLTNYSCRNNGTFISPDWCKPNMLGLLDQAFTDKLQFIEKEKTKTKDDW